VPADSAGQVVTEETTDWDWDKDGMPMLYNWLGLS
jgi:hypothetical protein